MTIYAQLMSHAKAWRGMDDYQLHIAASELEALAKQVCTDARNRILDSGYGCEIGEEQCKRAAAIIGGPRDS